MSVNLCYGIDQRKVRHLGPHFGSIDFHVHAAGKSVIARLGKQTIAGELQISGKKYRLSLEEIDELISLCNHHDPVYIKSDEWEFTKYEADRIVETLKTAKVIFFQKYRFGI